MVAQLKDQFHTREKKSGKVQILAVLSKRSSIRKIQEEFKASNYVVQTAEKSMAENGILSNQM
jgi:hypothetical protein